LIIDKLSKLTFKIFVMFISFVFVTTTAYVSGQEYNINPQAMQQIQQMAIQIQQMFDQIPPDQQEMAKPQLQKMMLQLLMQYSPEQQEFAIEKFKQMFPPQFLEKILPPGYN
jgi:hypothetical protein